MTVKGHTVATGEPEVRHLVGGRDNPELIGSLFAECVVYLDYGIEGDCDSDEANR